MFLFIHPIVFSFGFQFAWLGLIKSVFIIIVVIWAVGTTITAIHRVAAGIGSSFLIIIIGGINCVLSVSIRAALQR